MFEFITWYQMLLTKFIDIFINLNNSFWISFLYQNLSLSYIVKELSRLRFNLYLLICMCKLSDFVC